MDLKNIFRALLFSAPALKILQSKIKSQGLQSLKKISPQHVDNLLATM